MSTGASTKATPKARRSLTGRIASHASGLCLLAVLLIAWELSVRLGWVVSANWPALSQVLANVVAGLADGSWWEVFGGTLWRMSAGYTLACVVGILLGTGLAVSDWFHRTVYPTVELLRPLPVVAIVPPLILLLGVDDALKITVVAFACTFPVITSTVTGIKAVDQISLDVARTFRVPRLRQIYRIQIPSALPYIFAGMRVSLAMALIVTVIAEMIAGSGGVGYFVVSMQYAMRASDMYAAIILLSLLGYILNRGFLMLESRIIRWSRQSQTDTDT
ncbi:MAG: ABC transporter permease [Aquisalimonadaceae bacterium]